MNAIINEIMDNFNGAHKLIPNGSVHSSFGSTRSLRADVIETEDAYRLKIDVPGITRSQVSIDLEDGVLSISAQFSENKDAESENSRTRISERTVGKVERRFLMPKHIGKGDIKAKLERGVLTITIAKPSDEEIRKETSIEVS